MHSHAMLHSELEKMVVRMLFESYGVEKHYEAHAESVFYVVRVMKYSPQREDKSTNVNYNAALDVHTDKSFIAILDQDHVNGLQLQTKAGEWINVNYPPSSCFVLAGDALLVRRSSSPSLYISCY